MKRKTEKLMIGKPKPFRLKDIAGIMNGCKPKISINVDGTVSLIGPGIFAEEQVGPQTPAEVRRTVKRWEKIGVLLQKELTRWLHEVNVELRHAADAAEVLRKDPVSWKRK